ncbi:MAG: methylmalonyl Co-A mutase-associated GTPase MeaB [Phreatobacter sp.]|uniref:ArgK/MeaB family GTPase n=1 Tax=Phreatobacter sp. TaxID=1966341 RepID=UPI0027365355|nr:methylmalonyl Co-A mutase-associated GTPase MeaB [Phreatobacter sp.]MDP2803279.1 methylmalonyl Co-A mutase-associated GTPase MeaB [Phreatobacter sp.]
MVPASVEAMRAGGKRALAAALAAIETAAGTVELARFLDEACRAARGATLGLTGPPGVGKSTLTNALVAAWRRAGDTVGVIAVDPSSRRTGGALLGDRARISTDPSDRGVFVRSMAARDRLGGLSDQTVAAMVVMRAVFDRVLVESVGIGQSEADVAMVADTVVLCIQPGSGDSLQFMKAGVMELPDVIVVTKADMGAPAQRAKADVEGALTLAARESGGWTAPVVLASSATGEGLGALAEALAAHRTWLDAGRLAARRAAQERLWVEEALRTRFGTAGLALAAGQDAPPGTGAFDREHILAGRLKDRLA